MKHLFENVLSQGMRLRRENESECERKTIYCLKIYWFVAEITATAQVETKRWREEKKNRNMEKVSERESEC